MPSLFWYPNESNPLIRTFAMLDLAEPFILSINPYVAGLPIDQKSPIKNWAKLASNENCLGPSPMALAAMAHVMGRSHMYPNFDRQRVVNALCQNLSVFDVRPENICLGNGSSELIVALVRGLLSHAQAMMIGWPSFIMYSSACTAQGRRLISVPLNPDFSYDLATMNKIILEERGEPIKMVFLGNPNNPTGRYEPKEKMADFIACLPPDVVLVLDEAYFEYVQAFDYFNGLTIALSRPRTIVLRTFSKVHGLAGLRLGFAVGDPAIIDVLGRIMDPFNVNCLVQVAAIESLADSDHIKTSIEHNMAAKEILVQGLVERGFGISPGVGNFVLAQKPKNSPPVKEMCQNLFDQGVIIRPLDIYGLNDYVRISVGTMPEINQLLDGLVPKC